MRPVQYAACGGRSERESRNCRCVDEKKHVAVPGTVRQRATGVRSREAETVDCITTGHNPHGVDTCGVPIRLQVLLYTTTRE
jgi:hypothetical protein